MRVVSCGSVFCKAALGVCGWCEGCTFKDYVGGS